MRPPVTAATELTCCTKSVGEQTPERTATMNLMRVVIAPRAAARTIGSARWKPNAVRSESIPHSSAVRQKRRCASKFGIPETAERAFEPFRFSPAEDMLQ
jgi:hypothetical protein